MINSRTLELLKNPEHFSRNDLPVLEADIRRYPYIQNIRALYLFGVHRFQPGNYRQELSRTAAYTTDKKILYQFINKSKTAEHLVQEKSSVAQKSEEIQASKAAKFDVGVSQVLATERQTAPEKVYVNGELNRLLYPGEENFLDDAGGKIDLEATKESGSLVLESHEKVTFQESADAEDFSKAKVIEENQLSSDNDEIENKSNTSFESVETLSTETAIDVAENKIDFQESADAEDFSKAKVIEENQLYSDTDEVENESNTSFESVETLSTETAIDVAENKIDFQEAADAEDFSKEKVIEENQLSSDTDEVENESNTSFESVETLSTETAIDVAEDKIDFQESADAEDFSKAKVIEENQLSSDTDEVENESNTSFESVETLSTETAIDVAEDKIDFQESADAENFSKETLVEENDEVDEQKILENSAELSFHGTEDFMPGIQVKATIQEHSYEVPKPKMSRHEEEMQRLIAEVEAKMKASKKKITEVETEIPVQSSAIDFSESQEVAEVPVAEEKEDAPMPVTESQEKENKEVIAESKTVGKIDTPTTEPVWKPMSVPIQTPDSVQHPKQEISSEEEEKAILSESQVESEGSVEASVNDERPVFNVSFLSDSAAITPKSEIQPETEAIKEAPEDLSNVPQFINTWQNWLKIDRSENNQKQAAQPAIKSKVIEKFIETEPKISPLKDENTFVVKEKSGDISHLMTGTLANLYVEQKLYTKALKAFEILKTKHPEKADYFEAKIAETKEIRGGNFK